MGFLDRRQSKRNKIPDLSRYQQQNTRSSHDDDVLSTNAASSALRTYSLTGDGNNYGYDGGYGRSNSLSSFNGFNARDPGYRANSLSGFNSGFRSNSLSQRTSSLRSNSLRSNSLTGGGFHGGATEPQVIIHTTHIKDEYGRTKSITTETIRKYGNFELVKTETTPMLTSGATTKTSTITKKKKSVNNNARDKFGLSPPPALKYANSITSQELGSIQEEEEAHPYKSILKNNINQNNNNELREVGEVRNVKAVVDDGSESGESIYSDAYEVLPRSRSESPVKKPTKLQQPVQLTPPIIQPVNQQEIEVSPQISSLTNSPINQDSEKITENFNQLNQNHSNTSITSPKSILTNGSNKNQGQSNQAVKTGMTKMKKRVSIEDFAERRSRSNSLLSSSAVYPPGNKGNSGVGGYNDWFRKDGYSYGVEGKNKKKSGGEKVSDDVLYERAYELAMKKVYGEQQPQGHPQGQTQGQLISKMNSDDEHQDGARSPSIVGYRQNSVSSRYAPSVGSGSGEGFKRYSMREGGGGRGYNSNDKNYNYQLYNKFGSEPRGEGNEDANNKSGQKNKKKKKSLSGILSAIFKVYPDK